MPAATRSRPADKARRRSAAPVASAAGAAKPTPASRKRQADAARASLTISSRNYSSWSLRGWLMARFAGLAFDEVVVPADDANVRKELLLMAPSILVPCLAHDGARIWNVMAIGLYLDEIRPGAGLLPEGRIARAHCRSICEEMNSGFANLRSSLPVNLKARFPGHKVWGGARPDIERVTEIWRDCLARYGGPYLFGARRGLADAMYAPVVTRFVTYDVALDPVCAAYCQTVLAMPEMQAWIAAARLEPDEIEELEMDF